ncbi:PTS system, Fru family, IIC component [Enterococcus pallens]|nr:PTS system, Fru family, IIC component [Enterococcus pallens]
MLPFVIAGGILVALGFAVGGVDIPSSVEPFGNVSSTIFWVGKRAFAMMTPVLGAYVAFAIADKPAICSGMVGGLLADEMGAGFIGALVAGIIAGFLVRELKKIPLPLSMRSLLPTLIIPIISVLVIGFLMIYVIGKPMTALSVGLTNWLEGLGTGSAIMLGIIHGCMIAFDMGGPLNKASYAFALAASEAGNWIPLTTSCVAAMTPPLGIAIAMIIMKKKFTKDEFSNLPGLITGGIFEITEFAIPFAVADPFRVIPALMAGSAVSGALCYASAITLHAPHGGLFVVFLSSNPGLFVLYWLLGGVVTAICLLLLKKSPEAETQIEEEPSV